MVCGGSKVYFGNKAIVIFVSRELSWYYFWIYWLFNDYSAICTYVQSGKTARIVLLFHAVLF